MDIQKISCICDVNFCTGCFACMNVCPKAAINIHINNNGCTIPIINHKKCINCNACINICPQKNKVKVNNPICCYAAVKKTKRADCTSGGIAAALAEKIVINGGVAYGAVIQDGIVQHIRASNLEECINFRGSKYVQSQIAHIYSDINKDLDNGKKVIFIGTPCQVAGIKSCYKKYNNLYCVDLICHGVAPMKYLSEHINNIIGNNKSCRYRFRDKSKGYVFEIFKQNKSVYKKNMLSDTYFFSFMKGISLRENCFNCYYAQPKRCGDITIGDFWGLDRKSINSNMEGFISVVTLNTLKGENLFEDIKAELIYEMRNYSEAVKGNSQLNKPTEKHKLRPKFIVAYNETDDFDEATRLLLLKRIMLIYKIKETFKKIKGRLRKK